MASEISYDYYYGDESNQFSFYRIPRQLVTGDRFKQLSTDAKLLYGLLLHTPDQQLHLHGILAPPCRKGAPLHESKERDLYNWRSTGNCDYINWRSHHAKLSGDLETG